MGQRTAVEGSEKQQGAYLQHLLVILRLAPMDLLDGLEVLFEVDNGMLPGLQSLGEEASGLLHVRQIPVLFQHCHR